MPEDNPTSSTGAAVIPGFSRGYPRVIYGDGMERVRQNSEHEEVLEYLLLHPDGYLDLRKVSSGR